MTDAGWTNAINQGGAIGIMALLIIGIAIIGKYVALPMLTTWLAIAKEQSATAETLRTSLETSLDLQREQRATISVLERMVTRTPPAMPRKDT